MKLTVKTLKGGKFEVEVDDSNTVEQVKEAIEKQKSELPAAGMKLIHSGKVLKDGDTISSCGIKPNDFLVVMVTKAKKAVAAAPPAAAPAATATAEEEAKTPAAATSTETAAASTTTGTATTTTSTTPAAPSTADDDVSIPAAAVESLVSMGFPEAEVRHCLRVAHGNPDVAVEFLTNGIPDAVAAAAAAGGSSLSTTAATNQSSSSSSSTSPPLQSLRNHPQFDALRRLVQSNPAMLQQVLTQIGQQQPELLREINEHQSLFLQMMNEPITETTSTATSSSSTTPSSATRSSSSRGAGGGGAGSPGQMAQLIQNMTNEEVAQMAAMMGLSPDQLRQTAQMIGSMPPEQLNQFMMQAMGGEGGFGGGAEGLFGGGGGGGQVVRLTEEEMAAVDRLTEMGFDRSEAAQAFLACDKNEALAANLLMDSMGDGGGGFFGGGGSDHDHNNNDNNNNDDGDNDDADDMYD